MNAKKTLTHVGIVTSSVPRSGARRREGQARADQDQRPSTHRIQEKQALARGPGIVDAVIVVLPVPPRETSRGDPDGLEL
jgi:hypothetical protein